MKLSKLLDKKWMAIPNPWYTVNNSSKSYQIPSQNLLHNLPSEVIGANEGSEDNILKNLLMELKLRRQIIGKLMKRLDEEKKREIVQLSSEVKLSS